MPTLKVSSKKLTGEYCKICARPQFTTVHGVTCENRHGGAPSVSKVTLSDKFRKVEAPRRISATELLLPLDEIKKRIPTDVQMHVMHTDGVGWTVVLVDRVLGCVRGYNEDADHDLARALVTAMTNAQKKSN